MAILKKKFIEENVYDLALNRMRHLYDKFDKVAVSFSGGKDSTVVLNLALIVARERNQLPVDVICFDEEAIHPETVDYMRRVYNHPDVNMRWFCLPIKHKNACSSKEIWWYPWAPEAKDKWCREMPPEGITELKGFNRSTMPDATWLMYPPSAGRVAICTGVRADESLRRFASVSRRTHDNYISQDPNSKYIWLCKPIYDWRTSDVWAAPKKFGWDWNRAYDLFDKAGISPHVQRVCPPYGDEPLQNLWLYAVCYPELWDKMINRVHGAATAGRYCRSPLYFRGGGIAGWNPEEDPQKQIDRELEKWPPNIKADIKRRLENNIAKWFELNPGKPIPIDSGRVGGNSSLFCWKYLYMIAQMGDVKGRRGVRYVEDPEEYKRKMRALNGETDEADDDEGRF